MTGPALAAGMAALADVAHVDKARSETEREVARLAPALAEMGLTCPPSVCNFLLVQFPKEAGRDAKAADAFLKARGIILRGVGAYGLGHALRMTIGTPAENDAVLAALREFMGAASKAGRS